MPNRTDQEKQLDVALQLAKSECQDFDLDDMAEYFFWRGVEAQEQLTTETKQSKVPALLKPKH
jgi:hypothetical protein